MTSVKTLKASDMHALLAAVIRKTGRAAAPVLEEEHNRFALIDNGERFSLPEVNTVNSIKEFFFPQSEVIAGYERTGRGVTLTAGAIQPAPLVIFGARPCDAGSLTIMDKLFNCDEVDESWKARRDAATMVAIACRNSDSYCFCTGAGLAPDSREGADVLLLPMSNGDYLVESVTAKGAAFVETYSAFIREGRAGEIVLAEVKPRVDAAATREWLEDNFESALWASAGTRCLGCGICTYYCPTCHCFDIQDEADGGKGARFRTWDSCSFTLFTKHTSGHNPRPERSSRWRQRIMHKFYYYPERFGVLSCTGCGRCGRLCPVDLGVEETLAAVSEAMRET